MRPNSSYYPPYHPNDTTCLAGISIPTQQALDSLLREIKCKRIFYAVKTGRQEYEKCPKWNYAYNILFPVIRLAERQRSLYIQLQWESNLR